MSRPEDPRPSMPRGALPPRNSNSMPSPSRPPQRSSNSAQSYTHSNPNWNAGQASTSSSVQRPHQLSTSSANPSATRGDSVESSNSETFRKRTAVSQIDSERPMKVGYRSIGGRSSASLGTDSITGLGKRSASGNHSPRDKSDTPDIGLPRSMQIDRLKGKEKERNETSEENEYKLPRAVKKAIDKFIDAVFFESREKAEELYPIKKKIKIYEKQLTENAGYDDQETWRRLGELQGREEKVEKEYERARSVTRAPMAYILTFVLKQLEEMKQASNDSSKDPLADERFERMDSTIEVLNKKIEEATEHLAKLDQPKGAAISAEAVGAEDGEDSEETAINELKLEFDVFREEQTAQLAEQSDQLPSLVREIIDQVREEVKLRKGGAAVNDLTKNSSAIPASVASRINSKNSSAQPSPSRKSSAHPRDPPNEPTRTAVAGAQSRDNMKLHQLITELSDKYDKITARCASIEADNVRLKNDSGNLTARIGHLESEIKSLKRESLKVKKLPNEVSTLANDTNDRIQKLQEQLNAESEIGNSRNVGALSNKAYVAAELETLRENYRACMEKLHEVQPEEGDWDLHSKLTMQKVKIMENSRDISALQTDVIKLKSSHPILGTGASSAPNAMEQTQNLPQVQPRPVSNQQQQHLIQGQQPSSNGVSHTQESLNTQNTGSGPNTKSHEISNGNGIGNLNISSYQAQIPSINGDAIGHGSGNGNANRNTTIVSPVDYPRVAQTISAALTRNGKLVSEASVLQTLERCNGDVNQTVLRLRQPPHNPPSPLGSSRSALPTKPQHPQHRQQRQ